jgi:hypothetical protein
MSGSNADPYATLIPEGQYRVIWQKTETGRVQGGDRFFVHFIVSEPGEYQGLPLRRFYNVPKGRLLPRSHNLAQDFMALTNRRPPSRLKPDQFLKGCEVLAEVTTVKRSLQRRELSEDTHYSKIDRLIRITAGSPPCLIRGK